MDGYEMDSNHHEHAAPRAQAASLVVGSMVSVCDSGEAADDAQRAAPSRRARKRLASREDAAGSRAALLIHSCELKEATG